ncbi:hypothetical protein BFD42_26605 [Escherichia coli]|nr:hypothetical protein BK334_27275 [Escherichia coli]ROJ95683.1 hypothetical protein BFD42_26605 [Escherichia coli]
MRLRQRVKALIPGNNKLLIDVSVSMPAAIALDIILPHMSKSIFTEKLAANFGLAAFPLLNWALLQS